MLGFVCFMGPGLFNALNGLGGGGQLDASTSANANSALYATFAAMAFFSGWVDCLFIFLSDVFLFGFLFGFWVWLWLLSLFLLSLSALTLFLSFYPVSFLFLLCFFSLDVSKGEAEKRGRRNKESGEQKISACYNCYQYPISHASCPSFVYYRNILIMCVCTHMCTRKRNFDSWSNFFEAIKVVGDSPSYLRKIEKKYETRCVRSILFGRPWQERARGRVRHVDARWRNAG